MIVVDLRGKLPVHKTKKYNTRKASDIRSLAIHHSLTFSGSAQAFATYHINTNGWPGIAYTYVIDKDGTINQCLDHTTVGYHVGNSNKHALGICLVGDFRNQKPTDAQYKSALELVRWLQLQLPNAVEVKGHSQYPGYSWKACPVISMDQFRLDLNRSNKNGDDRMELSNYQWNTLESNVNQLLNKKIISDKSWLEKVQKRTITNSELNWLNNVIAMRLLK
ncbi:MAG TPA: peptidoglycan recognition protein family protein [Candidatus Paenibacillus intestinavium]|nr:peptidoglycan recognition protein family protein [Candidatus Paenibacillus intestinavium]